MMNYKEELQIREKGLRTMKALFRFVKAEKREELRTLIAQEEKEIERLKDLIW